MSIKTPYKCQCGEEVTIDGGEIHILMSETDYQNYLKAVDCLVRRGFIPLRQIYDTPIFLKRHDNTKETPYAFRCYYNPQNLNNEHYIAELLSSADSLLFLPKLTRDISYDEEKALLRTKALLADCMDQLFFVRKKMKTAEVLHTLKNSGRPLGSLEIARRVFLHPSSLSDHLKILQRKGLIKKEIAHIGLSKYNTYTTTLND